MSTEISKRLSQLADERLTRRRRIDDVLRQSATAMERIGLLRSSCAAATHAGGTVTVPLDCLAPSEYTEAFAEPGPVRPEPAVLDQVRAILGEMDTKIREFWSEDDRLLLQGLQQAVDAAARKGYSMHEVQAILEALKATESGP